jgi:hypothetical protein
MCFHAMVTLSPYLARLPRRASYSSTSGVLSVHRANESVANCAPLQKGRANKTGRNRWDVNYLQDVYNTQRDGVLHLGKFSKLAKRLVSTYLQWSAVAAESCAASELDAWE